MRTHFRSVGGSLLLLFGGTVAGCGGDGSAPPDGGTFAEVQATVAADCAACHGAASGRIFRTTMDSAQLVNSGFIDPSDPAQSLVLLKPTGATAHGGGTISSFTPGDQAFLATWIALQPSRAAPVLTAVNIPAGSSAPTIDGFFDAAWGLAPSSNFLIGGGWADATSVRMTALHDATYLYLRVSWTDDQRSDRRQPWVKQANGTWLVLPAKSPVPTVGTSWTQYMGAGFEEEDRSRFNYEDKLAIMWNTYGPSTVAGFEAQGCAVTCHDPGAGNAPGTSYNYTDPQSAAKKYTNAPAEIADLWHWKMVRNNQHAKMDDQFVQYWVPGPTGSADGGRASDAGTPGYASNPATSGHPTYRGPTTATPPYYIFDGQKVALTDPELAALPVGAEIANMITSGPTLGRADIDAVGIYNTVTHTWVMEIRRRLVTGESTDVQFDDLTRTYSFGVAVFDNAQIEHSYMPTPARLVFQP